MRGDNDDDEDVVTYRDYDHHRKHVEDGKPIVENMPRPHADLGGMRSVFHYRRRQTVALDDIFPSSPSAKSGSDSVSSMVGGLEQLEGSMALAVEESQEDLQIEKRAQNNANGLGVQPRTQESDTFNLNIFEVQSRRPPSAKKSPKSSSVLFATETNANEAKTVTMRDALTDRPSHWGATKRSIAQKPRNVTAPSRAAQPSRSKKGDSTSSFNLTQDAMKSGKRKAAQPKQHSSLAMLTTKKRKGDFDIESFSFNPSWMVAKGIDKVSHQSNGGGAEYSPLETRGHKDDIQEEAFEDSSHLGQNASSASVRTASHRSSSASHAGAHHRTFLGHSGHSPYAPLTPGTDRKGRNRLSKPIAGSLRAKLLKLCRNVEADENKLLSLSPSHHSQVDRDPLHPRNRARSVVEVDVLTEPVRYGAFKAVLVRILRRDVRCGQPGPGPETKAGADDGTENPTCVTNNSEVETNDCGTMPADDSAMAGNVSIHSISHVTSDNRQTDELNNCGNILKTPVSRRLNLEDAEECKEQVEASRHQVLTRLPPESSICVALFKGSGGMIEVGRMLRPGSTIRIFDAMTLPYCRQLESSKGPSTPLRVPATPSTHANSTTVSCGVFRILDDVVTRLRTMALGTAESTHSGDPRAEEADFVGTNEEINYINGLIVCTQVWESVRPNN